MKKIIQLSSFLCVVLVALAFNAYSKQQALMTQAAVQATKARVAPTLQSLVKEMISDKTVRIYVLSGVEFGNAHAAWFRGLSSEQRRAFREKSTADRAAHRPVESPIMTRNELENVYKLQASQYEQVKKKFPALAQLSDEDYEEVIHQVERGVIINAGVHEIFGSCYAGYRACTRQSNNLFVGFDACYSGALACLVAETPSLP